MIDHDELTRRGLEQVSNRISRHRLLAGAAKGIFAAATALAVGGIGIKQAWATVGCCCSAPTNCYNCPTNCINNEFDARTLCPPSGWSLCTDHRACPYCDYSSGYWGCGCGVSLYYCADCWRGDPMFCSGNGHSSVGPCTCSVRSCTTQPPP